MFSLLSLLTLAQLSAPPITTAAPSQDVIVRPQDIRPLPGQLNEVPVLNSNNPEVIYSDGILVSTFPPN
ncbi:MAG: DUF3370 family protein, partial [Kamptonema sp. SIO4C4]|nr:DUF3370 family protein [Kamptonema sp. SIO4C4]